MLCKKCLPTLHPKAEDKLVGPWSFRKMKQGNKKAKSIPEAERAAPLPQPLYAETQEADGGFLPSWALLNTIVWTETLLGPISLINW